MAKARGIRRKITMIDNELKKTAKHIWDQAINNYKAHMHDAYDLWDDAKKDDKKLSQQEAACMATPRHRKLREDAYFDGMRILDEIFSKEKRTDMISMFLNFTALMAGPDPLSVQGNRKLIPEQIHGYSEYMSPNADEMYLVAMFIMDDIVAQGREQWFKLCALYHDEYQNEYTKIEPEGDIWDEISVESLVFGSVPLLGPDWILGSIMRTIKALDSTGGDRLFVNINPRKRNYEEYKYIEKPKNEREKWESIIALMHPDTIKDACERFRSHAWSVLIEYSDAANTMMDILKMRTEERKESIPILHSLPMPKAGAPRMDVGEQKVSVKAPSAKAIRTMALFVCGWHHPSLGGGKRENIPWDWESMKETMEGVPRQPELKGLKPEEAQSLLFAAVLLYDCSDTIMYLTPMASWVVRKVATCLPIAPAHVQLARQVISVNITKEEEEQTKPPKRVWRPDPWCITLPEKEARFMPAIPEDDETTRKALALLTKEQFRFMYSRCIMPLPYCYHAAAPVRNSRLKHLVTRPVPGKYKEFYQDPDAYMNMLVCISNIQKYTAAYVVQQQVKEYKQLEAEFRALKEEGPAAQPAEDQSDELGAARAALKNAEELIRQKNEEIRGLKERLGEQVEEAAEAAPEEAQISKEASPAPEPLEVMEVPQKYKVQCKTIIVGGAKAFIKNLQKVLEGDVRYIDINTERPDLSMCLGGNVYIQTFYLSHKLSVPVVDYCKKNKIQVQYCESSGAPACIRQIIKYDKRMAKAAQRKEGGEK